MQEREYNTMNTTTKQRFGDNTAAIPWKYLKEHHCYLWERAAYCRNPEVPAEQCMNIYVPEHFLTGNGELTEQIDENGFNAKTVPVIFENGLAGYHEAEPFNLEDSRSAGKDFLSAGFVYVSCGCRGRSSENIDKKRCGKSPLSLVDLKAGIRFLRHFAEVIPGDMEKIVSVGISAGGAMSTLLGATGNSRDYEEELKRAGAFMDETDDIFAAQCYCPIIDLDHADLAYEWLFRGETHYMGMPFVGFGEGNLTPYEKALSDRMADAYPEYFNSLGLTDPETGAAVTIGKELEGSGYAYLMKKLEQSAAKYLKRLETGDTLSGARIRGKAILADQTEEVEKSQKENASEANQQACVTPAAYIAGEFARRVGAAEEEAILTGNGPHKPTGLLHDTLGAEPGVTAASAAAITADELIDLQHSVKSGYRRKGLWIMNDATLKLLRKLKDGQGNFIWQLGLLAGQPDTLFNQKVMISNFMPLPAAGNKAILYGDLSYYWLADREGRALQRLDELYAAQDQIGFKVTQRVDGRLLLRESVKCLQMKAA